MKLRSLAPVCVLLLGACTFEPEGPSLFEPSVGDTEGSSTGVPAPTTGDPSSSSSSTTSVADESTGDPSTSGSHSTSSTSDTEATSGTSGSSCGNGVRDDNEECDDANDDEFDGCTSVCTVPACDDGEHNGEETDLDCGGACEACVLCQSCQDESDCDGAMVCNADAQCVAQFDIVINWAEHCGAEDQGTTIEALPAGSYRATATLSAGTRWYPPHDPPSSGYYFQAECNGTTFDQMRTPAGVRYADTNTSFANMISETETFDFLGGDFTCWVDDDGCDDNNGTNEFSIESVCER